MLVPLRLNLYPHYAGGYDGDFGGYHPYRYRDRVRFKFADEEEHEAAPVIEEIAERVISTKRDETRDEIELILRLRLEQEKLIYKICYLDFIIEQQRKRKNTLLALLLLT